MAAGKLTLRGKTPSGKAKFLITTYGHFQKIKHTLHEDAIWYKDATFYDPEKIEPARQVLIGFPYGK